MSQLIEPQKEHLPTTSARGILLQSLNLDVVDWMQVSKQSRTSILQVGKDFNAYLTREDKVFNWESVIDFLHQTKPENGLPYKPASIRIKKYALKKLLELQPGFTDQLVAKEILDRKFKQIEAGKANPKVEEKDYLKKEELDLVIDFCYKGKKRRNRVGFIVQALFETGCRISELLQIQLSHCKVQTNSVNIEILGKGQKERNVFMKRKTYDAVRVFFEGRTHLFESENHQPLFRNNIYRSIQRTAKQAGLEKDVHPHTLRHSCAMHLLNERNLSPKAVSTYLGHANVATTLNFYIHDMPTAHEVFGWEDEDD